MFVNISYVDYVSNVPVALTLLDTNGTSQHVSGMRADGLATVAAGLRAQTAKDGRRWASLIQQSGGKDLRALSPNSGITLNPDWFATYWTDYVNQGGSTVKKKCTCPLTQKLPSLQQISIRPTNSQHPSLLLQRQRTSQ